MNSPGGTAETGSYRGRKALVWGLGRHGGGVTVTRYLASSGATVTVVDEADEHSLARAVEELADLNEVEFRLGESLAGTNTVQSGDASREVHELFAQHDLVVVNPAIPNSHPAYRVLRDFAKPTITSELDLLLCELADVPLIAVSGSNGKSSVCLWIVRLLRLLEPTKWVALGGNFEPGLSPECPRNLLSVLSSSKWATSKWGLDRDRRKPDLCVLELSSFQLARVDANLLNPKVAAITNLTPNHLDWHQSLDDYVMAKSRLFESVSPTVGKIVLPRCPDDPITKLWQDARHSITPDIGRGPSCWSESERANAATTAAVVEALGYSVSDDVLTDARPNVPHRQTLIEPHDGIRFHDGLRFIDDSAATTPEAVYPLLKQYGSTDRSKLIVIAGGRNKGADLDAFARALAANCHSVATIGETASELAKRIAIHGGRVRSHRSLEKAVRWARKLVPEEGVIALSPGMASTDQFSDYCDRGNQFRETVLKM